MLGYAESEHPSYLTVKLFSKNSNLCDDHDTSTSRTDGETDRQTDRQLAVAISRSAYSVASRGNK